MAADQQFCLRWNNHQSTLVSVFDTLLEHGTLVDCTLAAEGQYMKAHKVLLSACSPYFETLLSQHYDKHPIVVLKDVKFYELKALMDYMYRGEVNISQDQLGSLLKVAESLQIKGLSDNTSGTDELPEKKSEPRRSQPTPLPRPNAGMSHAEKRPPVAQTTPARSESPSVIRPSLSRDSCPSPVARKRKKHRTSSSEDTNMSNAADGFESSSSCELPPQSQPLSTVSNLPQSVPSVPAAPVKTSTRITPNLEEKKEHDVKLTPRPSRPPSQVSQEYVTSTKSVPPAAPIKTDVTPKIETSSEVLLEPKSEIVEETEDIEDLTLDDDEEEDMSMSDYTQPGPSQGEASNQGFMPWQLGADQSQDEVFMAAQEAVGGQRDSQDKELHFANYGDSQSVDGQKEHGALQEVIIPERMLEDEESQKDCYKKSYLVESQQIIVNNDSAKKYSDNIENSIPLSSTSNGSRDLGIEPLSEGIGNLFSVKEENNLLPKPVFCNETQSHNLEGMNECVLPDLVTPSEVGMNDGSETCSSQLHSNSMFKENAESTSFSNYVNRLNTILVSEASKESIAEYEFCAPGKEESLPLAVHKVATSVDAGEMFENVETSNQREGVFNFIDCGADPLQFETIEIIDDDQSNNFPNCNPKMKKIIKPRRKRGRPRKSAITLKSNNYKQAGENTKESLGKYDRRLHTTRTRGVGRPRRAASCKYTAAPSQGGVMSNTSESFKQKEPFELEFKASDVAFESKLEKETTDQSAKWLPCPLCNKLFLGDNLYDHVQNVCSSKQYLKVASYKNKITK